MIQQVVLVILTILLFSVPAIPSTDCRSVAGPELTKGFFFAENYNRTEAAPHFATALRLLRACGDERDARLSEIGYI